MNESWKGFYNRKPPTIEEFLTEEWLGDTIQEVTPYMRTTLIELFSSGYDKRVVTCCDEDCLLLILMHIYVGINVYLMKDPYDYFSMSPVSTICGAMLVSSYKKGNMMLDKFKYVLEHSLKFKKCVYIENSNMYDPSLFYWKSYKSSIYFGKNMKFNTATSIPPLLGLQILCGSMYQVNDPNEKLFYDLQSRIFARFYKEPLTKVIKLL